MKEKKKLIGWRPGSSAECMNLNAVPNVIKPFTDVIYKCS
jgi:hypothetical protein